MLLDQFDDSNWVGGNVTAWGLDHCSEQREIATGSIDNSEFRSLKLENLNKETLSDFEALMLGEISNDGCSEDEMDSATSSEDEGFFPLMELPLEIRLQIYRWVHLMTPIQLTQFAPWYPNPVYHAYHVKAVALDTETETDSSRSNFGIPKDLAGNQKQIAERPQLLSPYRPNCCMPTSILIANRQIYHESRHLPFLENEFVFVNWFTSGLWAARSFMKGLQPWQLTMRYARLELLSRDLMGRSLEDWRDLCEAWAPGLKGLRLKILNGGGGGGTSATGGMSWVVAGPPQKGAPTVKIRDSDGNAAGWIETGLKLLKRLQHLEVELSVADWDARAKLEWCQNLEEAVNESKAYTERHVRVCCVERVAQEGRKFVCL